MVWAEMTRYLDPGDSSARTKLERAFVIDQWKVPGQKSRAVERAADVPPGAPDWWRGAEHASQSFLREMQVRQ